MDSQLVSDQGVVYVMVVHPGGMFGGVVSVSGFPNPRVLGLVQHVRVITRRELMGVGLRLKDVSFCQLGVVRDGLKSGFRWFMVISSSYEPSDCCDWSSVALWVVLS